MVDAPAFPLSPQQRRLWSVMQASGGGRLEASIAATSRLDPARLRRAVERVVARTGILRTRFLEASGLKWPVQTPSEAAPRVWREAVLEQGRNRRSFFDDAAHDAPLGPIDTRGEIPFRVTWVDDGAEHGRLFLSSSALCMDRRSVSYFVRDVAAAYDGRLDEAEPIPYVQYAAWHNDLLTDDTAPAALAFWRQQNLGELVRDTLPFERQSVNAPGPLSQTAGWAVPADMLRELESVACACGSSLASVLFAAWCVVLARLTGASDVVIGELTDGREPELMPHAIGPFARQIPVRQSVPDNLPFADLVRRIHDSRGTAQEWGDHFTWDELDSLPTDARHCAFGFDYEQFQRRHAVDGGTLTIDSCLARYEQNEITFCAYRSEDELTLKLQYDAARYSGFDVDRVLGYLRRVVQASALGGTAPTRMLSLPDEDERRWLVDDLNRTETQSDVPSCLHRWYQNVAARRPDAVAVAFRGESLSYAELERRANQLAHYLQQIRIGPEVRVAMLLERSLQAVVALFAIWKAGGVYVPLDPAQPRERLGFMVADCRAALVITERRFRGILDEALVHLYIDADWTNGADLPEEPPTSATGAANLAYIIYTSGSTGEPKGVMVCHGAVANLAHALQRAVYDSGPVSRVSVNAPLTFDASIKQIVTLVLGVALELIPDEVRADARTLLSYLDRHAVDAFDCTPFQLRQLLDAGWTERADGRPCVVLLGGECVDVSLLNKIRADSRTTYWNLYGPTECTVDVTAANLSGDVSQPIVGRPLANVRTYILDAELFPVPQGVVGELYVAGRGVARGYTGRADLTAASFLPDPFHGSGERMYRTGDLANHCSDGSIVVIGRRDRQVKLHGYRIELEEIEAVLRRQSGVREAVVVMHSENGGEPSLVGYFAGAATAPAAAIDVRARLRQALPEYMLPAKLIRLAELPRSAHGKVDRSALPNPFEAPPEVARDYVPPQNQVERAITEIWARELNLERVGVHDNFFDLGGHSLLLARVHARLRSVFDREISIVEMFRHPTIALLAQYFLQQSEQVRPDRFDRSIERSARRRRRGLNDGSTADG